MLSHEIKEDPSVLSLLWRETWEAIKRQVVRSVESLGKSDHLLLLLLRNYFLVSDGILLLVFNLKFFNFLGLAFA